MPEAEKASHGHDLHNSALVKDLARATGVGVGEVAKVLEHLGVARVLDQVVRATGKEPTASDVRVAFRLGGSVIVA
jgi:hypothetical protein